LLAVISAVAVRQASRRPYLLVGWLWYLGTLVPVIGIVQVGDQASADRYTYLPMIGLTWALVWGLAEPAHAYSRHVLAIGATAACLALIVLTERQLSLWRNSEDLWKHTLRLTANNCVAHGNLGVHLLDLGRHEEAREQFELALCIRPKDSVALHG